MREPVCAWLLDLAPPSAAHVLGFSPSQQPPAVSEQQLLYQSSSLACSPAGDTRYMLQTNDRWAFVGIKMSLLDGLPLLLHQSIHAGPMLRVD